MNGEGERGLGMEVMVMVVSVVVKWEDFCFGWEKELRVRVMRGCGVVWFGRDVVEEKELG